MGDENDAVGEIGEVRHANNYDSGWELVFDGNFDLYITEILLGYHATTHTVECLSWLQWECI